MLASVADLRLEVAVALRRLRNDLGFTAVALLTLGLGIGFTTAMFTVVNGVLLRPLPIQEQNRVLAIWKQAQTSDATHLAFSQPSFRALREALSQRAGALKEIAAVDYGGVWRFATSHEGNAALIGGGLVSGDFFGVLGVRPVLGRPLQAADDVVGAARVVVVSYGLWQRRFGGDTAVLGTVVRLWGSPYTIVGVMPRGFEYPRGAELWTPLAPMRPDWVDDRTYTNLDLIGRLNPLASVDQARMEINAALPRLGTEDPALLQGTRLVIRPFAELIVGEVRVGIVVLAAGAVLVLMIATVNIASLLLVRGVARQREVAVRLAIGADRWHIARQALIESLVLALLGAVLGVLVAAATLRALVAIAPAELPRADDFGIDLVVLSFTTITAIVTAGLFGLVPALSAARVDLHTSLKTGGRVAGVRTPLARIARPAVVAGQVALALVVLAGAALLTQSLLTLQRLELGFASQQLSVVQPAILSTKYTKRAQVLDLLDRLLARIQAVPGVVAATPVLAPPLSGTAGWDIGYTADDQSSYEASANPHINFEAVSSTYFQTIGLPIQGGRAIAAHEAERASPVVVVSATMARLTWPGQAPIGRRIKFGDAESEEPWRTVVGVVPDTRYRDLTSARPTVYVPYRQQDNVPFYILLRTGSSLEGVIPAVRQAVTEVDADVAIVSATSLTDLLAAPLAQPRFNALLLGVFATVALALASMGIYGVVASSAADRTREMGIRMALGATPAEIRHMLVRQGLIVVLGGMVAGLAAAIALNRTLTSLLFGITPTDPATLTGISIGMLVVAVVACYVPARRLGRIELARVLTSE